MTETLKVTFLNRAQQRLAEGASHLAMHDWEDNSLLREELLELRAVVRVVQDPFSQLSEQSLVTLLETASAEFRLGIYQWHDECAYAVRVDYSSMAAAGANVILPISGSEVNVYNTSGVAVSLQLALGDIYTRLRKAEFNVLSGGGADDAWFQEELLKS
jgi:hypothetical protein